MGDKRSEENMIPCTFNFKIHPQIKDLSGQLKRLEDSLKRWQDRLSNIRISYIMGSATLQDVKTFESHINMIENDILKLKILIREGKNHGIN